MTPTLFAEPIDLSPLVITGARARRSDPAPSHLAARMMNATGKAKAHRALVLEAVAQRPGGTAAEYAHLVGLDHVEAQRRLSDMLKDRAVEKGPARKCQIKGSKMTTWRVP